MAAPQRQRSLVFPREHGAWGILLVPLVTGTAVGALRGGNAWDAAPLAVAALALFWLRTPVESWLGTATVRARTAGELALVRRAAALLGAVSLAALAWLFWGGRNRGLVALGGAAGAAFLAQTLLKRAGRTAAQMIGSVGLTSVAAAAAYVTMGHWSADAWVLWAANLLFAVNQIHYVQLRIHAVKVGSRREKLLVGGGFFAGQCCTLLLLAAACVAGWLRWTAAAAFVPILARGFAWFVEGPRPLAIYRLGKSELAQACVFGVLLVAGMTVRF